MENKLERLNRQVLLCKVLSEDLNCKTNDVCKIISSDSKSWYNGYDHKADGISQSQIQSDIVRLRRELNKLSKLLGEF